MNRILIVEDEQLLALMLEDLLLDAGYAVEHAFDLATAERVLASQRIDCAILDINVDGALVFSFADRLRERRIPFVFASSLHRSQIPPDFHSEPLLGKPYGMHQVLSTLASLLHASVASPGRRRDVRAGRTTGEHPVT